MYSSSYSRRRPEEENIKHEADNSCKKGPQVLVTHLPGPTATFNLVGKSGGLLLSRDQYRIFF